MEKFKITELVAATYRLNNDGDADRTYKVSAEVSVNGDSVQSISNGSVSPLNSDEQIADFNDYGNLNSNIYNTDADRTAVFTAISDFCKDVRNSNLTVTEPISE